MRRVPSSKNGGAPSAAMGGAAKRGWRLQERNSFLQKSRVQGSIVRRSRALLVVRSPQGTPCALRNGVVRRHGEERGIGLRALDIGERVGRLPGPRIAVFVHHRGLQIVGIPAFPNNRDGL